MKSIIVLSLAVLAISQILPPASASPYVGYMVAPVVPSQYRVHDIFGQYQYGYSDGRSGKVETQLLDGSKHGAYSYVDPNGKVQTVKYIADAKGFRVEATNLPKPVEA